MTRQTFRIAELEKQNADLLVALKNILDSEVYADAEGMLTVERGGLDDTEHREIVAKARAAIKAAEGA